MSNPFAVHTPLSFSSTAISFSSSPMARAACPAVIIAVFIILVHPFVIFFLLLDRKHFVLFQGDWIFCFLAPPYLLIVVCLAFFRAGSENLPTCVFQVRFSPRKHGVRGNECQKRSVVSVWYAQNSLPFCTEVWYTTLTSCEDPTKMLMRVCTLLLMQPAPLTGTATLPSVSNANRTSRCSPHPSRGQKRRRHIRFCVTPSFLLSRGGLKPL